MFKNFGWKSVISEHEKIELEFGISLVYSVAILIFTTICGIAVIFTNFYVGFAIIVLGGLYFWYLNKGKHFAFTDKRVVMVDAFVGREIVSVDYTQITDIELEQSPFDQMGGWGTLSINTAGTHAPEIKLTFVNNPQKIRQELDRIRINRLHR